MSDCSLDFSEFYISDDDNGRTERIRRKEALRDLLRDDAKRSGYFESLKQAYKAEYDVQLRLTPPKDLFDIRNDNDELRMNLRRNWIFMTLSPKDKIDKDFFIEWCEDLPKRSWVNKDKFIACIEKSKAGRVHFHMTFQPNINYTPGQFCQMIYRGRGKHFCDKGGGIDVRKITRKDAYSKVAKYIDKKLYDGDTCWGPLKKEEKGDAPVEAIATKSGTPSAKSDSIPQGG